MPKVSVGVTRRGPVPAEFVSEAKGRGRIVVGMSFLLTASSLAHIGPDTGEGAANIRTLSEALYYQQPAIKPEEEWPPPVAWIEGGGRWANL